MGSPPQVRGKRNASYHSARFGRITPAGAGKTLLFANFRAFQWDHPRRCGENFAPVAACMILIGSPPQVRGKHSSKNVSMLLMRITPAGAGKTFLDEPEKEEQWDHPRRCGENEMQVITARVSEGSPPQVRGKHSYLPIFGHFNGITPAGAGKTSRPLPLA